MHRIVSSVVAAAAVTLILTGCTSTAELPAAPSPTASATAEPAPAPVATQPPASVETTTPTPDTEVITPTNPGVFMTPSGTGNSVDFVSPSRNLACNIYSGGDFPTFWGCKAVEFTFDPGPASSEYCHMVGSVEGIDDQPVKFGCRTDEPFRGAYDDTVAVLDYGKSITFAGVQCVSREDGMTCDRASSGHGFDISRTEANLW